MGAAESIGTTSTMKSPGEIRSLTRPSFPLSAGTREAISSFSSRIFFPLAALTSIDGISPGRSSGRSSLRLSVRSLERPSSLFALSRSHLFFTMAQGMCLSRIRLRMSRSSGVKPWFLSITKRAMSVLFKI